MYPNKSLLVAKACSVSDAAASEVILAETSFFVIVDPVTPAKDSSPALYELDTVESLAVEVESGGYSSITSRILLVMPLVTGSEYLKVTLSPLGIEAVILPSGLVERLAASASAWV